MRDRDLSGLKKKIDLNLDAGESEEALANGLEEKLYRLVSSVNIACGGHAGTMETMSAAVRLAMLHGLSIGAHPSFPDRAHFGRRMLALPPDLLLASLIEQIRTLNEICESVGLPLGHVKPHGALYNAAAFDLDLAKLVIDAVQSVDDGLVIVGLAGSPMLEMCKAQGLRVAHEAFVDRRYESSGALRARSHPDALILDPVLAADQALKLATGESISSVSGERLLIHADTLCIHGDTTSALETAIKVRETLDHNGVEIASFQST